MNTRRLARAEDRPKTSNHRAPWRTTSPMMPPPPPPLPAPTLFRTTDGHCAIRQRYHMDTSRDRIIDVTNRSGRRRRRRLRHHRVHRRRRARPRRDFTSPRPSTTPTARRTWDTHTRVRPPMSLRDSRA